MKRWNITVNIAQIRQKTDRAQLHHIGIIWQCVKFDRNLYSSLGDMLDKKFSYHSLKFKQECSSFEWCIIFAEYWNVIINNLWHLTFSCRFSKVDLSSLRWPPITSSTVSPSSLSLLPRRSRPLEPSSSSSSLMKRKRIYGNTNTNIKICRNYSVVRYFSYSQLSHMILTPDWHRMSQILT